MSNNLRLLKWLRGSAIPDSCLARHRIFGYKPGGVFYQFGNYPTRNPYYPTEADWNLLDLYAQNGLTLINIREPWSDINGFFGKEPTEPVNEKAFRRFIEECHRRGLKAIPYVSPGYMDVHNPAYRPEWSRGVGYLVEVYEKLDHLCPGSPGHRARFFSTVERIMDCYELDGLYLDGGTRLTIPGCFNPHPDDHVHFSESNAATHTEAVTHDDDATEGRFDAGFYALWNDFFCEVYGRIKKRDGIAVVHIGADRPSLFEDKCWDYQLVGEGITNSITSVEKTKTYAPYIVRFNDWSRLVTNWEKRDLTPNIEAVPGVMHATMAACIPYMQFPWIQGGFRDLSEDMSTIPGVRLKTEWDHWTEWRKVLKELGDPFVFTGLVRDIYFKYLKLFRKMTSDNTIAHIEITGTGSNSFPVTKGTLRVSVFVNDSLWVTIGNLAPEAQKVEVLPLNNTGEMLQRPLTLSGSSLTVLRYFDLDSLPEVIQLVEI